MIPANYVGLGLLVGASFQQSLHHLEVALEAGKVEGCPATLRRTSPSLSFPNLLVRSSRNEDLRYIDVPLQAGQVEGRFASLCTEPQKRQRQIILTLLARSSPTQPRV